jgi:hypothetical protein
MQRLLMPQDQARMRQPEMAGLTQLVAANQGKLKMEHRTATRHRSLTSHRIDLM